MTYQQALDEVARLTADLATAQGTIARVREWLISEKTRYQAELSTPGYLAESTLKRLAGKRDMCGEVLAQLPAPPSVPRAEPTCAICGLTRGGTDRHVGLGDDHHDFAPHKRVSEGARAGGADMISNDEPRVAHSKSEFKRLTAMGVPNVVLNPLAETPRAEGAVEVTDSAGNVFTNSTALRTAAQALVDKLQLVQDYVSICYAIGTRPGYPGVNAAAEFVALRAALDETGA